MLSFRKILGILQKEKGTWRIPWTSFLSRTHWNEHRLNSYLQTVMNNPSTVTTLKFSPDPYQYNPKYSPSNKNLKQDNDILYVYQHGPPRTQLFVVSFNQKLIGCYLGNKNRRPSMIYPCHMIKGGWGNYRDDRFRIQSKYNKLNYDCMCSNSTLINYLAQKTNKVSEIECVHHIISVSSPRIGSFKVCRLFLEEWRDGHNQLWKIQNATLNIYKNFKLAEKGH